MRTAVSGNGGKRERELCSGSPRASARSRVDCEAPARTALAAAAGGCYGCSRRVGARASAGERYWRCALQGLSVRSHVARCTLPGALPVACCTVRVACCTVRVACCTVRVACCTVRVACCTVRVACCMLHGASCMLHVARCELHVARCPSHVARCELHAVCCAAWCTVHGVHHACCTVHVACHGFPSCACRCASSGNGSAASSVRTWTR